MATYNSLSVGSTGNEVKKLQQALSSAGYNVGNDGESGSYGTDTQNAVRQYQQNNGLTVDGVAGDQTLSSLYRGNTGNDTNTQESAAQPVEQPAYNADINTAYEQAIAALQAAQKDNTAYTGSYDAQIRTLYDQIVNRDKFKYDINEDMLYRQYAEQYAQQGRMAMMDAMGQAAALTGGYGSSYGQSVGQQQYDAYLQKLNDVIPDLYQSAYNRYQDEWSGRLSEYGLALNRAELLADSGDFSGFAAIYGDEAAESMKRSWISSHPDLAYRNGMITADDYWNMTGKYPAGYTAPSTGTSSYWDNYDWETAAIQRQLKEMGAELTVDGKWGRKTQAAWEKYMGSDGPDVHVSADRTITYGVIPEQNRGTEAPQRSTYTDVLEAAIAAKENGANMAAIQKAVYDELNSQNYIQGVNGSKGASEDYINIMKELTGSNPYRK